MNKSGHEDFYALVSALARFIEQADTRHETTAPIEPHLTEETDNGKDDK